MSQHIGSHKNTLNLLGEKYLNASHWLMCRIRQLECKFIIYIQFLSQTCPIVVLIAKHY